MQLSKKSTDFLFLELGYGHLLLLIKKYILIIIKI